MDVSFRTTKFGKGRFTELAKAFEIEKSCKETKRAEI